jgi:hypothetical protein
MTCKSLTNVEHSYYVIHRSTITKKPHPFIIIIGNARSSVQIFSIAFTHTKFMDVILIAKTD